MSSENRDGDQLALHRGETLTYAVVRFLTEPHEARLARWLLMVQDRIEEVTLQLTQEFLAEMLGARRTTVALSAGALQRAGMIEYCRGRVTIVSREALENAACDCYQIARRLHLALYK
jgi:CRP-like cAMP-binding protein